MEEKVAKITKQVMDEIGKEEVSTKSLIRIIIITVLRMQEHGLA